MHRIIPILTFVFLLLIVEAVNAQQGIGTNTPDRSAAVEIKSASRGLLIPRVALMATNVPDPVDNPAESLMVYNTNTTITGDNDVTPGYYYWKRDNIINPTPGKWMRLGNDMEAENGLYIDDLKIGLGGELNKETIITQGAHDFTIATETGNLIITDLSKEGVQEHDSAGVTQDHLLAVGNDNVVKALKAAMPKFFYMPSIVMPTAEDQFVTGDGFTEFNGVFTVNLYDRYTTQFRNPSVKNPNITTTLPVLPATELDYYITWYDNTVFENVSVTDTGILTYTISATADITMGTFMNIVFAVKP